MKEMKEVWYNIANVFIYLCKNLGNLDSTNTGNSRSSRKSEHQEGSDGNGLNDDDHRRREAHIVSSRPHSSLQRHGSAKPGDREGQNQNSLKGQERGKRNVVEVSLTMLYIM